MKNVGISDAEVAGKGGIFSIGKFSNRGMPNKLVPCRKCSKPVYLVESNKTGRWFTVDQINDGRWAGDYVRHCC